MELLEDGVPAFQLIPSHSPQIWQQLVPLLSTQPVCLASLGEGEQRPQGVPTLSQEPAPDLWEEFGPCWLLCLQARCSKEQAFRFSGKHPARR